MKRDLNALTDFEFDLVVIGGGIFGACAAWDATQRGLSVALVERDDFCSATSANSYKIVHGGIRYIQHGDVYRVRQSSHERKTLLKIAPHLVRPLPIAIPTYGYGMKGKAALRIGMGLYDLCTVDKNRGIDDPDRQISWGRCISRAEAEKMFPGLASTGLTGAGVFSDAQMYNPPRLVLAFIQNAVKAGARVANYLEATGFIKDGDTVKGIKARDKLSGNDLEIRARVVLNAAGPYAERLLKRGGGMELSPTGVYSRDACFVVPRRLLSTNHAVAVQGATRDPDAKLSRGERHIFIVPWREYTLIGTWHLVYKDDPDRFKVTDAELEAFIEEINAGYPGLDICIDDVSLWNAGLVPFGENTEGAKHLRYGHRSRLVDHTKTDGVDNLITLIGVRFTTGRYEAVKAINLVYQKLGRKPPRSRTDSIPLHGADFDGFEMCVRETGRRFNGETDEKVIESLVSNYGSEAPAVLRYAEHDPGLAERVGNGPTIKAQVLHAAREEMAEKLGDVVFRRTDLATGDYPGSRALVQCAEILGAERGWDNKRIEKEINEVIGRFSPRVVQRVDTAACKV